MRDHLSAAIWAGIDLLLPPRCPACGDIVDDPGLFCTPCWTSLRFITAPLCADCGLPFELPQAIDARCGACLAAPPRYSARAAFAYEGAARDVVLALKHADRPHLAIDMAAHLARIGADWLKGDAMLVPVPLHRWRLWRRGYNQAAELARALARETGLPLLPDALVRRRATASSQGLTPPERRRNLRAAFAVNPKARTPIIGRCIILVDDVFTTGATADACARMLLRTGATSVRLLTFARVVRAADAGHIAA
jgi:ComF family protein